MAINTFPNIRPHVGSSSSISNSVVTSSFGDGYEQSFVAGINPEKETATNKWVALKATEKDQIVTFLRANVAQPFYWTNLEGVQYKYKCDAWTVTPQPGNYFDVDATFRRVYAF